MAETHIPEPIIEQIFRIVVNDCFAYFNIKFIMAKADKKMQNFRENIDIDYVSVLEEEAGMLTEIGEMEEAVENYFYSLLVTNPAGLKGNTELIKKQYYVLIQKAIDVKKVLKNSNHYVKNITREKLIQYLKRMYDANDINSLDESRKTDLMIVKFLIDMLDYKIIEF